MISPKARSVINSVILYLFLAQATAQAAPTCSTVFVNVKPFSVTGPGFIGKLFGRLNKSDWYYPPYKEVIPYAKTTNDLLDLFASFKKNGVPKRVQKEILSTHPLLISLKATEKNIDQYIEAFNKKFASSYIQSVDSPLFNELNSPKVVDQCSTGTCWINASTSVLESVLSAKKGGQVEISEQYLYLQSLIYRALDVAINKGRIQEGGSLSQFVDLCKKHGIVYESDWTPVKHVYALRPQLISTLTELTIRYRPLFKAIKHSVMPAENLEILKKDFIKEARERIENFTGPLPKEDVIQQLPSELTAGYFSKNYSTQATLNGIATYVDKSHEVYLVLNSTPRDFTKGHILSISSGTHTTSHAMAVVGYIKDQKGQVQLLKIKNSWGKTIGDQGFIYLDASFLCETYIESGVIMFNDLNPEESD